MSHFYFNIQQYKEIKLIYFSLILFNQNNKSDEKQKKLITLIKFNIKQNQTSFFRIYLKLNNQLEKNN